MSSDSAPAIAARGVSKRYYIGHRARPTTLAERVVQAVRHPFAREDLQELWALKNCSFDVARGDLVGIIGRNGAGKSTLLKLLSRITEPTEGEILMYGRVRALLEVGTGFHPELTGRENVYLNGTILGMRRREVAARFDEIVAFAEVDRFLETPVKHYSSGMYVRLGFAVAAHLEPEILFVDEVLAVGDAAFQKKCLGKMGNVSRQGRTIIFVSHNMIAMKSLCDRVVWLDEGSVLQDGPAEPTISAYLGRSAKPSSQCFWPDPKDAPGNDIVRIRKISIHLDCENAPVGGSDAGAITVRTPVVIRFEYWNLQPGAALSLSLHIYDGAGTRAFATFPLHDPRS